MAMQFAVSFSAAAQFQEFSEALLKKRRSLLLDFNRPNLQGPGIGQIRK